MDGRSCVPQTSEVLPELYITARSGFDSRMFASSMGVPSKTTLPKHSRHCDHDHCLLLTLNPPPRTRTTNTRPRNNAFPDPHTLWHGIVAPRNCEKAKLLPVSALLQLDSVALGPTGSDKWKLTFLAAAATCTIVTVAI